MWLVNSQSGTSIFLFGRFLPVDNGRVRKDVQDEGSSKEDTIKQDFVLAFLLEEFPAYIPVESGRWFAEKEEREDGEHPG